MARVDRKELEEKLRETQPYEEWRAETPRGPLHYYTSLETGVQILSNREIWVSSVRRMDDSSELVHGRRMLDEVVKDIGGIRLDSDRMDPFTDLDDQGEADPGIYDIYALCLSSDPEDVHQWERYGNGGHGIALGFKPARLGFDGAPDAKHPFGPSPCLEIQKRDDESGEQDEGNQTADEEAEEDGEKKEDPRRQRYSLIRGKVIYTEAKKKKILKALVETAIEEANEVGSDLSRKSERSPVENALRNVIGEVLPFFKGPTYEEESEWRLCALGMDEAGNDKVHFRAENGLVTPFLKVSLKAPEFGGTQIEPPRVSEERTVPHQVHAGPGLTPRIHERSLQLLLNRTALMEGRERKDPELRWISNCDLEAG